MKIPNISDEYILSRRKEIGLKLKEIREAKGLSMEQLGELLNENKTTISKMEAGKWNFGIERLIAFGVVLGFDVELITQKD